MVASIDTALKAFADTVRLLKKEHAKNLALSAQERAIKSKSVKEFCELFTEHSLPSSTKIRVDDTVYSYAPAVSERISAEEWLGLYEKKLITKKQFLDAISVQKSEASNSVGQDVVLGITKKTVGDVFDLRSEKSTVTEEGIELIHKPKSARVKERVKNNNETKKPLPVKRRVVANIRNG